MRDRGRDRSANVVISGDLSVGKTTLAHGLQAEAGYAILSAREILRSRAPEPLDTRRDLQDFGLKTESATHGAWLGEAAAGERFVRSMPLVIDSARTSRQVKAVREALPGERTVHIHLTAQRRELEQRFLSRHDSADAHTGSLNEAVSHLVETPDEMLEQVADIVIDTTALGRGDVLQRVLRHV